MNMNKLPLSSLLKEEYRGKCVDQIDTTSLGGDELPEHPLSSTPSILTEALEATSGDRRRDYDHALPNHQRIAFYWNAHLRAIGVLGKNAEISPADVAMLMILLKVARQVKTPKRDNLIDIAGYARCVAQIEEMEP